MQASLTNSIVQRTSVPTASLFDVISLRPGLGSLTINNGRRTTVSVTNGVGVQLRGGCASKGPWVEKHRAALAMGPGIQKGDCWIDRLNWRRGTLGGIFKIMQRYCGCMKLQAQSRETWTVNLHAIRPALR